MCNHHKERERERRGERIGETRGSARNLLFCVSKNMVATNIKNISYIPSRNNIDRTASERGEGRCKQKKKQRKEGEEKSTTKSIKKKNCCSAQSNTRDISQSSHTQSWPTNVGTQGVENNNNNEWAYFNRNNDVLQYVQAEKKKEEKNEQRHILLVIMLFSVSGEDVLLVISHMSDTLAPYTCWSFSLKNSSLSLSLQYLHPPSLLAARFSSAVSLTLENHSHSRAKERRAARLLAAKKSDGNYEIIPVLCSRSSLSCSLSRTIVWLFSAGSVLILFFFFCETYSCCWTRHDDIAQAVNESAPKRWERILLFFWSARSCRCCVLLSLRVHV